LLLFVHIKEQYYPQKSQPTSEQLLRVSNELQHFAVKANPTEQPEEFRQTLQQLDSLHQVGRDLIRW